MASEPAPAVREWTIDRRDLALACACGAVALAAYLRTLAPGLTADLDSPLFQFIGRALGVAHNPGYPLYTLLTWPIAQVPIGELAWRINVFSAVMGAVATGLVFLAARRLEARPIVSVGGGARLRRRRDVLVAGGDRRGLHAARRARRRPARRRAHVEPLAAARRTSTPRSAASPPGSATTPRSWPSRRGSRSRRCSSIGTSCCAPAPS